MIDKIIDDYAIKACFIELHLKSKPGLVSKTSRGSHKDMDYFTMKKGILSLRGYFGRSFLYGFVGKSFSDLRKLGRLAEKKMYERTKNINTHLGAIFLLGILCFLIGRIKRKGILIDKSNFYNLICFELNEDKDFKVLKKEGYFGARKEVVDGYKMSFSFIDTPLIIRLLNIIKNLDDTNVKRRGGEILQKSFKVYASNAIKKRSLKEINDFALKNNLSPGGAADILINSIFINLIINFEKKRKENYLYKKLSHNEKIYNFISNKNILVYSLVFPGIEKDLSIFREFYINILKKISNKFGFVFSKVVFTPFGYYSFANVCGEFNDFINLKKCLIDFEKIGIIDLDLYYNGEPISRESCGFPQRKCLICEKKAKECYINERHTKKELIDKAIVIILN